MYQIVVVWLFANRVMMYELMPEQINTHVVFNLLIHALPFCLKQPGKQQAKFNQRPSLTTSLLSRTMSSKDLKRNHSGASPPPAEKVPKLTVAAKRQAAKVQKEAAAKTKSEIQPQKIRDDDIADCVVCACERSPDCKNWGQVDACSRCSNSVFPFL